MVTIDEALRIGIAHHQAGRLPQAEQVYRQVLDAAPNHTQALHLLGVVAMQSGRFETAIALISNAIRLEGNNATLHLNLGEAYRESGNFDEAQSCYARAMSLDPTMAQPHFSLAIALEGRGNLQAAAESHRRAIALHSDYADAHYALGNVLSMLGDRAESIACYERAVQHKPDFYEAVLNLGSLLREAGRIDEGRGYLERAVRLRPQLAEGPFFLGNLEAECQNWAQAIAWYEQATRLNPNMAKAEARLGSALQVQGQIEAAMVHYRRAIQLQPGLADPHFNLGTALAHRGQIREALAEYELTLQLDPNFIDAHINLGAYFQDEGDEERALMHINRAIQIDSTAAEPRFNRALILLARGELAAGWADFQARLRLPTFPVLKRSEPLWDGTPIPDKSLLLHAEQGLGDTFHFIRYVRLAQARCPNVILQLQPAVIPLLKHSGFERMFTHDDPLPTIDLHAPLMSLPAALGTNLDNVPAEVPYLAVPDEAVAAWKSRLADVGGVRVGIVWQGSTTHVNDAARSIPLAEFAPLARIPGVTLVNLQKCDGLEQLDAVDFPVHQIEGAWDEAAGPFVDTAAIMRNLDLVVTADTAAAHLAGALGVSVWVALWARADWRWMRNREDTPWYPTMRLFRQAHVGQWSDVFARMASELTRYAAGQNARSQ